MRAERLDGVADLDAALVDRAAGSLESRGDVGDGDGAEEATALTGPDGHVDRLGLEPALDLTGLLEVVHGARVTGGLDGLDLLGRTLAPPDGEVAGQQVVAGVSVLDLDDVAGLAEVRDLVREDELCHDPVLSAQRPLDV